MTFWRRKKVGRTYTRSSTVEKGKGRAQPQARPTAALNERAHLLDYEAICRKLKANTQDGLTDAEAQSRLEEYGENALEGGEGVSAVGVLIRQMANALTLVLVAAMALSYGVQDWIEGATITAVIVLNITVGFFQEYRAEKTMDSLRSLSSPTALVIRGGQPKHIAARHVVPGDIVMVKPGDVVPADIRLFSVANLEVGEALLTGEALPVAKTTDTLASRLGPDGDLTPIGVGDRINLAYASTNVSKGRGSGIVVATGMGTQVGAIALTMNNKRKREKQDDDGNKLPLWSRIYEKLMLWLGLRTGTPLQIKLSKLAYVLFLTAVILAIIVFGAARFRVNEEVAIYAIALAISVIPEGLIAVLTITMSAGTSRMAKNSVIVRRLNALEALGGVTDICSDKTGTLTQGKMIVRKAWIPSASGPERNFTVESSNEAINPEGRVFEDFPDRDQTVVNQFELDESFQEMIHVASMCNVATISKNQEGRWRSTGDPTEVALQVFATKLGNARATLTTAGAREDEHTRSERELKENPEANPVRYHLKVEFPFDSSIKRMSTVFIDRKRPDAPLALLKGAVEQVQDRCSHYLAHSHAGPEHTVRLIPDVKERTLEVMEQLAGQGLRVLALASRRLTEVDDLDSLKREDAERDFTFIGLVGIYDPPRPESIYAVRACKEANIAVHMLTGDHAATARAIAKEIEIVTPDDPPSAIMTAAQFNKLTDKEIDALPELPLVIARCDPETKVRMILAAGRRGKYTAMTGDGVNDAPSLKLAPVGIAMGMEGSDVAKDASELVLTDDNFDSIRLAVSEGRRIFDNIQRFILHLLCVNVGECILLVLGLAFLDSTGHSVFPLSPLSILWINMVTSSPPAFGLGMEPPAARVMRRPPHSIKRGVFTIQIIIDILYYGLAMGITVMIAFVVVMWGRYDGDLGTECNRDDPDGDCIYVFRARSTVFATLILEILLFAWELKALDRSMFNITPGRPFYKDLWANKILFWTVVIGCASIPLAIYIPVFNSRVFYQAPITWEWGIVIGMTALFMVAVELYKILVRSRPWFENLGHKKESALSEDISDAGSENEGKREEISKV